MTKFCVYIEGGRRHRKNVPPALPLGKSFFLFNPCPNSWTKKNKLRYAMQSRCATYGPTVDRLVNP
jgi:hypothetical protein